MSVSARRNWRNRELLDAILVALGGIDEVRIRGRVVPGDRLVIALQQSRV